MLAIELSGLPSAAFHTIIIDTHICFHSDILVEEPRNGSMWVWHTYKSSSGAGVGISSWENHIYVLLKGHRHGDFAARWAKPLKYLAKKKTIMCFNDFSKVHMGNLNKLQSISILAFGRQK